MVGVNERQAVFVREMARGLEANKAARLAGYASPDTEGYRLLTAPNVQRAIHLERQKVIAGPLAGKALAVLDAILSEAGPASKLKLDAAKFALTMAGHAKAPGEGSGLPDKPLGAMSKAELDAYVDKAQAIVDAVRPIIDVSAQEPGATEPEQLEQPSATTP